MKNEKHKSGFKVPGEYFGNFTDRLLDSLAEQEVGLPQDEGFSIPKGYFEGFNDRLGKRIAASETKVIPLNAYRKYFLAAASIAALILLLVALPWQTEQPLSFEDLAGSDIEFYLGSREFDLTDDEIAQLLPVEELEMTDMMDSRLTEEHIVDYLDGSIEDYEDLNVQIDD